MVAPNVKRSRRAQRILLWAEEAHEKCIARPAYM